MTLYRLANEGRTTLAQPYVPGSGTMTVVDATKLPTTGEFIIIVSGVSLYAVSSVSGNDLSVAWVGLAPETPAGFPSGRTVHNTIEAVAWNNLLDTIAVLVTSDFTTPRAPHATIIGPSTGSVPAAPTWRLLIVDDIPALPYVETLTTRTAHTLFMGPVSGSPAAGTWRALAASDLPPVPGVEARGVNNGFEFCQRALPISTNNAYGHDRWQLVLAGTDTASIDSDTTNVKTDSRVAAKATVTVGTGASGTRYRQQLSINANEPHHGLRGNPFSVRVPVKLGTAVANAVRGFIETDGTGGTTTFSPYHGNNTNYEDLDVSLAAVPVDATYVRYGAAFAAGTGLVVYIDDVMPVISDVPVPYRYRDPAPGMTFLQRYYELVGDPNDSGVLISGCANAAGVALRVQMNLKAVKPVTPTITKNGTWGLSNASAQPSIGSTSKTSLWAFINATAAGDAFAINNAAGTNITVESNP